MRREDGHNYVVLYFVLESCASCYPSRLLRGGPRCDAGEYARARAVILRSAPRASAVRASLGRKPFWVSTLGVAFTKATPPTACARTCPAPDQIVERRQDIADRGPKVRVPVAEPVLIGRGPTEPRG